MISDFAGGFLTSIYREIKWWRHRMFVLHWYRKVRHAVRKPSFVAIFRSERKKEFQRERTFDDRYFRRQLNVTNQRLRDTFKISTEMQESNKIMQYGRNLIAKLYLQTTCSSDRPFRVNIIGGSSTIFALGGWGRGVCVVRDIAVMISAHFAHFRNSTQLKCFLFVALSPI